MRMPAPYRLISLNSWSPDSGTVWPCWRGVSLEVAFEFSKGHTRSRSLSVLGYHALNCLPRTMPAYCHALCQDNNGLTSESARKPQLNAFFYNFHWSMSLRSNRIVTKTPFTGKHSICNKWPCKMGHLYSQECNWALSSTTYKNELELGNPKQPT